MNQLKNGRIPGRKWEDKKWTTVEAIALLFLLLGNRSFASTSPNAFQNVSWSASSTDSSTPHRSLARNRDRSGGDISPFSPGSNNLSLDLGQVFLMGDVAEKFSNSLGTQLHYAYGVSELFGFDTSLGYSQHSGGKYTLSTLLTGLRMNMSWYDKIIPYLLCGLGFYMPSYQDTTVPGTTSPSITAVLFGLHIGPGVQLELSKSMFFGASLTYHNMFGTSSSWANGQPFTVGGAYTSFFMNIGATF